MTALLARRDDRCLSDLTMDRFLLGETSDSDEGRMLERHLAWCSACLARVQSLRTLYAHADMPEVTSEPAPVPGPLAAQRPDRVTGVLELILMRDGLLIGTEVFTPGSWILGSGPRAALKLDAKGVAPEHAKLTFRNDSVVVERAQGSVLVNGFRVERSEVRPIDELIVGPFVLRARVITRWSEEPASKSATTRRVRALTPPETQSVEVEDETQLITVPVARQVHAMAEQLSAPRSPLLRGEGQGEGARPPNVHTAHDANAQNNRAQQITLPANNARAAAKVPSLTPTPLPEGEGARTALRLDLFWGDALQASELVAGEVPSSAFPAFAPGREPSASAIANGYRLCIPGAKLEVYQGGNWVRAGDELTLTADTRARVIDGALRLEARLQHAPMQVAPAPKTAWLKGAFVPVLSFLMLGLIVFAGVASTFAGEEDEFAPRVMPKLSVSLIPPKPKTPEVRTSPDTETTTVAQNEPPKQPTPPRPPPPAPASRRPPPHLTGLSGMNKVLELANKMTRLPLPTMAPGKGQRQGDLFAGLGKVGKEGGKNGIGIGIGPNDAVGIGAIGAKNSGQMRSGRIGKGGVAGQVLGPVARDLAAPVGSIDRDAVLKVINSHLAEVSSCYERALLTNPNISGKLTFEWGIGTDGKVTVIKLKSATMKDANVPACISNSMKKWTFPKPRGGTVTVSFPFMFQPTGF
ncbi:MAG: AgmX/PglI C-terminal domain-containing protein [Archangium sp.]|nr:AgmX/PglI C-terminal domain-containing protein [Archangium sp.]